MFGVRTRLRCVLLDRPLGFCRGRSSAFSPYRSPFLSFSSCSVLGSLSINDLLPSIPRFLVSIPLALLSTISGRSLRFPATVFLFPRPQHGNNTYKGSSAALPAFPSDRWLQVLNRPVNDLSAPARRCTTSSTRWRSPHPGAVNVLVLTAARRRSSSGGADARPSVYDLQAVRCVTTRTR